MRDQKADPALIDGDEQSGWLVTYADMVTLLLVFFIMLFTMASFEKERYKSAVESVKAALNVRTAKDIQAQLIDLIGLSQTKVSIEDYTGLRSREASLLNELNTVATSTDKGKSIDSQVRDGKIVIRVDGQALFDSGSADLKDDALPLIDPLVDLMIDFPEYTINIKGHTDDIPISTRRFSNNWDLSAIRATTVLKLLILRGIDPGRLTATGYGDSVPLVPNTTEENRALNRRVEFVLEKEKRAF